MKITASTRLPIPEGCSRKDSSVVWLMTSLVRIRATRPTRPRFKFRGRRYLQHGDIRPPDAGGPSLYGSAHASRSATRTSAGSTEDDAGAAEPEEDRSTARPRSRRRAGGQGASTRSRASTHLHMSHAEATNQWSAHPIPKTVFLTVEPLTRF